MIVDTSPQGSLEWHIRRAGVITASMFKELRESARLKRGEKAGQYNAVAKAYGFKCAVERISKMPLELDEGFTPWQADRGHAMEPHARWAHELRAGIMVEDAGFIMTDDCLFGASADGFADVQTRAGVVNAGCEYKAFLECTKVSDIILHDDTDSVIDQCDGGMWIANRNLWHFGLFFPALTTIGLEFKLIPIERDGDREHELVRDLWTFNLHVEEIRARLMQLAGLNTTAPMAATDPQLAAEVNRELTRPAVVTELPEDLFA
jgi:hypothetical protein